MEQLLVNVPAAAAAVAVVILFLRDRSEDRKLWANHLNQMVVAQVKLAKQLQRLTGAVESLR